MLGVYGCFVVTGGLCIAFSPQCPRYLNIFDLNFQCDELLESCSGLRGDHAGYGEGHRLGPVLR